MIALYACVGLLALIYFAYCVRSGLAMREETITKVVQASLAAIGALILLALGVWPELILENQEVLHHLRLVAVLAVFPCLKELSDCIVAIRCQTDPRPRDGREDSP